MPRLSDLEFVEQVATPAIVGVAIYLVEKLAANLGHARIRRIARRHGGIDRINLMVGAIVPGEASVERKLVRKFLVHDGHEHGQHDRGEDVQELAARDPALGVVLVGLAERRIGGVHGLSSAPLSQDCRPPPGPAAMPYR